MDNGSPHQVSDITIRNVEARCEDDYLLPYLVIGVSTPYKTIPVAVQYLMGSYGAKDYGSMMALLVLAIIPIIAFYLFCQKYIIEGVVAGAVKG